MQQIADAVGVSKYVVSKSLSGKGGVNAATRERVKQAAIRLGYRVSVKQNSKDMVNNGAAAADKATVVVMLPNIRFQVRESEYWGRIVDGITSELESLELRGVVVTDQTIDSFLSIVQKDTIRGFIGVGEVSGQVLQEISRLGLPLVLIDHEDQLISANGVFANNRESVYQLTHYLLSLGHKRLRFVGNIRYSKSFYSRWCGFKDALDEQGLGLAIPDKIDPLASLQGQSRQEHTEEIREILMKEKESGLFPTALVCANDMIAIAATNALRDIGISIPQEASVTGFDNIEDSYQLSPRLTTVHVEKEMLGRRAAQMLLNSMRNPDFPQETVYMNASLIHRDSTAAPAIAAER
nr:LacI family DNA-binding transcriptional regulator [Paenibacillus sp. NEAU-GSW1]